MAVLQTTEVPVGSAGTPSLTFTGRTNDGIFSPAEDQVAVATAGVQRLLVGNATLSMNGSTVWHAGNDGAGSGLDADLVDGFNTAQAATASTVAVRNGDGTLTIADGTAASHAVTKAQLDAVSSGLDPKESVRAASTANVVVTYTATGGASGRGQITAAPNTLDGVTLAANNRILLKDQTTGAQNGIWIVTTVGTGADGVWDRATDFDADAEVTSGAYTFVEEGSTNADSGWTLITNNPIVIGGASGTALAFVQFSGAGQITAGAALTKTGNTLDVAVDTTTIEISADALRRAALTGDVTASAGSASTTIAANAVSNTKLRDSAALSVIGRSANSTGDPADIAATAASGAVLRESGSVIGFGTIATAGITDAAVTFAKIQDIATDTLLGRDTAATGDVEAISVTGGIEFSGSASIRTSAFTGDVTKAAGGTTLTHAANSVLNTVLRDSGALSVIGRSANTAGDPADISATAASDAVLRESGSVIGFGTIATGGITDDAITNAKLANMAASTVKGQIVGGSGDPVDLTADQLVAIVNTATTDIADARLSSNVPLLNTANSFTAANVIVPVALTDAANIATNAALGNVFTVTLGGNRTLDNPTNPTHGQTIIIHIKQDGTGNRTLNYGSAWAFKGASTVSTTAGFTDILSATYNSTDVKWHATLARQDVTTINAQTLDSLDSTDFLRTNGANTATAAITMDDTTHFWINLSGLLTTGIKWDTTANQIQFQDAGTTRAYVDLDNGELSATSIVETSDERLKEDITNIDGARALKQIKKMQGVYFTRKDTGLREVGLIAQRVKALEPMLVQEDNDGYLSVNYTRIVALLIEAVKEQQEQIDTLRQELDNVKPHG